MSNDNTPQDSKLTIGIAVHSIDAAMLAASPAQKGQQ